MPLILFLYWNWLQSLIEKRSKFRGELLFVVPAVLWVFFPVFMSPMVFVAVTAILGAAWVWPLWIFHRAFWKNKP